VPDEDDGLTDPCDHVAHVRGIAGEAARRVGDRDGLDGTRVQPLDDAGPARGFGEGAVNEHGGGSLSVMILLFLLVCLG
jgi:hypothetical protein